MGTPTSNKTASPIRPSKSPHSCRTSQLDKYLKYELSAKIINSFYHKQQTVLVTQFFNALRQTQHKTVERIYRFVAVEKSHTSKVSVDAIVSGKIMTGILKQLIRKRFGLLVQALQMYNIS